MEKISFVVQGPIFKEQASIDNRFSTRQVLLSIRKFYPDAEIVLSTWRKSDISNLSYDVLVLSEDPGGIPHKDSMINCNRMVISSKAGIFRASNPNVVKTRTDIAFVNSSIYDRLSDIKPIQNKYSVFSHFVLSSIYYVRDPIKLNLLFHPSDIFLVGKKADLLSFFDVPLAGKSTFVNLDEETKVVPEQHLFTQLILKIKGEHFDIPRWGYIKLHFFINSERFLFNNFLFFNTEALSFTLPERLYNVFMPHGNYTLGSAQRLSKIYLNTAGGSSILSTARTLQYIQAYHIPYLLSGGWKIMIKASLHQLSKLIVNGN